MTEVAHPTTLVAEDEPGSDPDQPTGSEDPFDAITPEDPYGVTGEADPLAPTEPAPNPTTTSGVELPPPEPPMPTKPPGHDALDGAVTDLGALPDPKNPSDASRIQCWRVAQEGRFSLSDHWATLKQLQLTTADVSIRGATDKKAEQAKLAQLRTDLATDSTVSASLDAWCAARDATPVDLQKLADAAGKLKAAVDPLQKLLQATIGSTKDPKSADYYRLILGQMLDGIVTEVAGEGKQALAGERVASGTSSDLATFHLERMTRDLNWSSRLMTAKTWADAGTMVKTAIDRGRFLKAPISKASGKLDPTPLQDALSDLDDAILARGSATPPVDYATRQDVLRRHLAAAQAVQKGLKMMQDRQVELSRNPKSAGWDIAQTRSAGDVLAGMARALHDSLGADPLVQDPDLAGATRTALGQIDALAQQTSLEGLVDKVAAGLRNDKSGKALRKVWSDAKNGELKALKASGADLGDLPKQFDSGLGPLLQKWSTDIIAKFPGHDHSEAMDLASQISAQLQQYRASIQAQLGEKFSSRLVLNLDVVAAAVVRQIRSYDSRGGLFS